MAHSEKTIYPRIGEEVIRTTLENGLPVFVVPKKDYRRKYAMFATRYGGMDMRFQLNGQWLDTPAGIAHYLEHKMFDTREGNALQLLAHGAHGALHALLNLVHDVQHLRHVLLLLNRPRTAPKNGFPLLRRQLRLIRTRLAHVHLGREQIPNAAAIANLIQSLVEELVALLHGPHAHLGHLGRVRAL